MGNGLKALALIGLLVCARGEAFSVGRLGCLLTVRLSCRRRTCSYMTTTPGAFIHTIQKPICFRCPVLPRSS